MSYRKILYGYQIQNGELTLVPEEAAVVNRIAGLYLDGLSLSLIHISEPTRRS